MNIVDLIHWNLKMVNGYVHLICVVKKNDLYSPTSNGICPMRWIELSMHGGRRMKCECEIKYYCDCLEKKLAKHRKRLLKLKVEEE